MKLCFLLIAVICCLAASLGFAEQQPSRPLPKAKGHVESQKLAPPPVPLSPEQMPAVPPQVMFSGGQLTIVSQNCTLGDILRAVKRQTGASVDVPGNATERVVGQFGPGPARDVLTTLLNGSHFNYVLLGSATNPMALDRVILISKSGTQNPSEQAAANSQPNPQQPAQGLAAAGEGMETATDDAAVETQPEPNEINIFADDQANQNQADDQQANPFGQPGFGQQGNVKTPEQLLQELQQRQQQMQQQMQQQTQQPQQTPAAPFGTPPPVPGRPQPPQ